MVSSGLVQLALLARDLFRPGTMVRRLSSGRGWVSATGSVRGFREDRLDQPDLYRVFMPAHVPPHGLALCLSGFSEKPVRYHNLSEWECQLLLSSGGVCPYTVTFVTSTALGDHAGEQEGLAVLRKAFKAWSVLSL